VRVGKVEEVVEQPLRPRRGCLGGSPLLVPERVMRLRVVEQVREA
jgi:hypothetical protein